jgi:hypothetical protein
MGWEYGMHGNGKEYVQVSGIKTWRQSEVDRECGIHGSGEKYVQSFGKKIS